MPNPNTLPDLIAQVESSNNQWAVRFEPAVVPHIMDITMYANDQNISQPTSRILLACSFGLYQIMGYNLLHMGLKTSFMQYCANSTVQLNMFEKFLSTNGMGQYITMPFDTFINNEDYLTDFARRYNGPGNPAAYAARMKMIAGV